MSELHWADSEPSAHEANPHGGARACFLSLGFRLWRLDLWISIASAGCTWELWVNGGRRRRARAGAPEHGGGGCLHRQCGQRSQLSFGLSLLPISCFSRAWTIGSAAPSFIEARAESAWGKSSSGSPRITEWSQRAVSQNRGVCYGARFLIHEEDGADTRGPHGSGSGKIKEEKVEE